jgi:hypothetical protein
MLPRESMSFARIFRTRPRPRKVVLPNVHERSRARFSQGKALIAQNDQTEEENDDEDKCDLVAATPLSHTNEGTILREP